MTSYLNYTYLIIICISVLFLTLFFTKIRRFRIIYFKNLLLPIICILFILCLLLFPRTSISAASKGISLWINIVFPSLFPFFVGSEILNKTGIVKALGVLFEPVMRPVFNVPGCGSFPFAMGLTSGYPVGAKLTTGLRQDNLITKTEGERLLAFTNNSSPLFIMGAVSVGMFRNPQAGPILLICHIIACFTVAILFRFYKGGEQDQAADSSIRTIKKFKAELKSILKKTPENLGSIIGNSIKNSINLMIAIGGFIIFFCVIVNLLLDSGVIAGLSQFLSTFLSPAGIRKDLITSLISGFFDITTGSNMVSSSVSSSLIQQLTAASVIIGWAGISVHFQVISIVGETDISIKPYLLGKFLQGVLAGIYTYIFLKIAGASFMGARQTSTSAAMSKTLNWENLFFNSCKYFLWLTIALILSGLIMLTIRFIKAKQ